jgi:hypothetical protein
MIIPAPFDRSAPGAQLASRWFEARSEILGDAMVAAA